MVKKSEVLRVMKELTVEEIKAVFRGGLRVELEEMVGETQMHKGLQGVIDFVDDIGQIYIIWDNGSTLALIWNKDRFKVLG